MFASILTTTNYWLAKLKSKVNTSTIILGKGKWSLKRARHNWLRWPFCLSCTEIDDLENYLSESAIFLLLEDWCMGKFWSRFSTRCKNLSHWMVRITRRLMDRTREAIFLDFLSHLWPNLGLKGTNFCILSKIGIIWPKTREQGDSGWGVNPKILHFLNLDICRSLSHQNGLTFLSTPGGFWDKSRRGRPLRVLLCENVWKIGQK